MECQPILETHGTIYGTKSSLRLDGALRDWELEELEEEKRRQKERENRRKRDKSLPTVKDTEIVNDKPENENEPPACP